MRLIPFGNPSGLLFGILLDGYNIVEWRNLIDRQGGKYKWQV